MFADTRETETVFAPVIQAGLEALKVKKPAPGISAHLFFFTVYVNPAMDIWLASHSPQWQDG